MAIQKQARIVGVHGERLPSAGGGPSRGASYASGPGRDNNGWVSDRRPYAPDYIDVDLWSPATFAAGPPYDAFAALRDRAPVAWHPEPARRSGGQPGPGFWCVTTHADITAVSVDPGTYSSWLGGFTGAELSPRVLAETRLNLMATDPPEHTLLRKAIREPFGPKGVERLRDFITDAADDVVDTVANRGSCEFVEAVASEVPLRILAHLLGVAPEDRRQFYAWSNAIIANHDPDYGGSVDDFLAAHRALFSYGERVIADKKANPGDDFMSRVVHARLESGEPVGDDRVAHLWYLFLVAANETTRSTLSGAIMALSQWPDQRELLLSDLDRHLGGFVEEVLRYNNAVNHFRRTATVDTELNGAQIRAGDKLLLWYPSANRDAAVFDEPERFDLTRQPNLHLAFGVGPHFCLGARLGRLSVATTLRALLGRLPDIAVSGPVRRVESNFLNWAKEMPVSYTPA